MYAIRSYYVHHVAGPADGHADISVGQIVDVLRRVEIGDVGTQAAQQLAGFLIILGIQAVGLLAHVVQHSYNFV